MSQDDIDTLTEIIMWLDKSRMRIHASDCTIHKPSARCSCGFHNIMSKLYLIRNKIRQDSNL